MQALLFLVKIYYTLGPTKICSVSSVSHPVQAFEIIQSPMEFPGLFPSSGKRRHQIRQETLIEIDAARPCLFLRF